MRLPPPAALRLPSALAIVVLACNEGLQPVPLCQRGFVGICGTVHFRGTLPDSTAAVYLVAYPTFPQSRNDLFNFVPFPPQSIPTADSTYFYTLGIPNGRYEWVLAAWVKLGFTTANADSTLREAGYYRDKADTAKPGVVMVNGTGTDSIDIVVDFDNMHPISYYFPAAAKQ
ncbi:MAG: hypothetical protein AUH42_02775 [Gemmatimonadetes bacterium 13_1_40CM_70_11]|nr:MAG: hypothetical protein AUH42_02775 [Gemmatimonadetes bacterium 13_1_40CM_70_11]